MSKNLWWGYVHKNGTIQVKRFFDSKDMREADESPFCLRTYGPFKCFGRDDAIENVLLRDLEYKGYKSDPKFQELYIPYDTQITPDMAMLRDIYGWIIQTTMF